MCSGSMYENKMNIYHQLYSQALLQKTEVRKAREDLSLHMMFCSIKQTFKLPNCRVDWKDMDSFCFTELSIQFDS